MPERFERLTLVTGNPNKLEEARRILRSVPSARLPELTAEPLDLPEIQSLDLREVLEAKAEEAWRRLRRPVVVEETGLEIEVFGGFPGPLVKWMLQAMGAEGLARAAVEMLGAQGGGAPRVLARCQLLALDRTDGERRVYGEGIERGTLVLPPRGGEGFGWDPVFLPEGETRTYGELPGEVKDEIGHRGKAWRDLVARLVADGDGGAGRDRVDQDG
jgi:non-canonical purine NTP pyrophosphatase (RdgB/HAM1 family)